MIRAELKKELEAIADKLNAGDLKERATKSVLNSLLGAINLNQEQAMDAHVQPFTKRLLKGLAARVASRN
jgi:hypothetical protein